VKLAANVGVILAEAVEAARPIGSHLRLRIQDWTTARSLPGPACQTQFQMKRGRRMLIQAAQPTPRQRMGRLTALRTTPLQVTPQARWAPSS
jgi:hypothetical protein